MKNKTGVQEWAPNSFNCVLGCSNDCRYCYAKKIKKDRFKLTDDWSKEILLDKMKEAQKFYKGGIMFPTAHDITIQNYEHCIKHLKALLDANNKVLVVSKMSDEVAARFVEDFKPTENLEIRISITHSGIHEKICIPYHFEGKSPKISERIDSLKLLLNVFKCSVSVEPLLDLIVLSDFIEARLKYRNNCLNVKNIWIGCLTNYELNPKIRAEELVIELYKTLPEIYEEYKQYEFIKWKDSFFKAMNRELKRRKKMPKFSFCSADNPKLNGRNIDTVVLDD